MSNVFDRRVASRTPDPLDCSVEDESSCTHSADASKDSASTTAAAVKQVTQELLKHGFIEEYHKSELFRAAAVSETEIAMALEPLDLELRLDAFRGVAFLTVARNAYLPSDGDATWLHPLVRRQRLTLEQSLLVALLRQAFALHEQQKGIGQGDAKVAVDDLLPQFLIYFKDSGSDAKNESRLLSLLDQLKAYGIVSEVDRKQEITIRPLIAYLADPESLKALLEAMKTSATTNDPVEDDE